MVPLVSASSLTDGHARKTGGFIAHLIKIQHSLEEHVVEGGAGKVPLLVAVGAVTPCTQIFGKQHTYSL